MCVCVRVRVWGREEDSAQIRRWGITVNKHIINQRVQVVHSVSVTKDPYSHTSHRSLYSRQFLDSAEFRQRERACSRRARLWSMRPCHRGRILSWTTVVKRGKIRQKKKDETRNPPRIWYEVFRAVHKKSNVDQRCISKKKEERRWKHTTEY